MAKWVVSALLAGMLAAAASSKGSPGRSTELADPYAGGAAAYLLEIDGRPIWSRDVDRTLPPASLTKIMTALLYLESGVPAAQTVTVSATAAQATGSKLHLRAGERMKADDLLAAMLLHSANDACVALAESVGGTNGQFVAAMNERARTLELRSTHFTNACGHDEPDHVSSVRDLAALTKIALRQPRLAELVRLTSYRVTTTGGHSWNLWNSNELIGRYPGAIGVKTGFTEHAGKCLIALAERDQISVLLVVLNAPNRWWDSVALLDRAFARAKSSSTAAR
jgi:D-alanyl-D-alanine carboxypeptidase (penicillin-binding protein 5/6)